MFLRRKKSGKYVYVQIVQNERVGGKVRQRVIGTLGREDLLRASGQLEGLAVSIGKYARRVAVLKEGQEGEIQGQVVRIGAPRVFGKLWRELGLDRILEEAARGRKFGFAVERAVFLTVLHRLMASGSDRAAEEWKKDYEIAGAESIRLHQLYRAMGWLGEPLGEEEQVGATPFAPRCMKDWIEEELFAARRELFSELELAFFDTTSLYFEGEGGEELGRYGHSKDHRPDRKQMVVGMVLDGRGRPLCSEFWPGNTPDVKTLVEVVKRLQRRFGVRKLCVVADRGMMSRQTVEALESGRYGEVSYILGVRMRADRQVAEAVLSRGGRYRTVMDERGKETGLKVKEVWVEGARYVVCWNEEEAEQDRKNREAIVASLQEALQKGDKALIGNGGYRRYVRVVGGKRFEIDEEKIRQEARYDGKWILRTTAKMRAEEAVLRYKELWRVEQVFRSMKSVLKTRPIYHQTDAAIRGHVFCSFLALVLLKELQDRMEARGWRLEWERLKQDLDRLVRMRVVQEGKVLEIRLAPVGEARKAIQAVGVGLGPSLRIQNLGEEKETA